MNSLHFKVLGGSWKVNIFFIKRSYTIGFCWFNELSRFERRITRLKSNGYIGARLNASFKSFKTGFGFVARTVEIKLSNRYRSVLILKARASTRKMFSHCNVMTYSIFITLLKKLAIILLNKLNQMNIVLRAIYNWH